METIAKPSCLGQRTALASARKSSSGGRKLTLQVVAAGGRPVGRAADGRVNRPYKTQRPEEGFNNEHPNAKKAAQMKRKDWHDASGRKGKGYGVYRFTDDYGDLNDYSPIYDPTTWSDTGATYQPGTLGITAWLALLATILSVGGYLIYSTSQLA